MTLRPRDPLPGHGLVFRVDTRTGRDTTFWCRVRFAFLPKLRGHCFWASDVEPYWLPDGAQCVILPRPLLLQFLPEFVRLSATEREYIRKYCLERDPAYIRNTVIAQGLKTAGLVHGRNLTLKGENSYHLSP